MTMTIYLIKLLNKEQNNKLDIKKEVEKLKKNKERIKRKNKHIDYNFLNMSEIEISFMINFLENEQANEILKQFAKEQNQKLNIKKDEICI